jgi:hypothetical protein
METKCSCTLCTENRFPESRDEITVFELGHQNELLPTDEEFAEMLQQILIGIELRKILGEWDDFYIGY